MRLKTHLLSHLRARTTYPSKHYTHIDRDKRAVNSHGNLLGNHSARRGAEKEVRLHEPLVPVLFCGGGMAVGKVLRQARTKDTRGVIRYLCGHRFPIANNFGRTPEANCPNCRKKIQLERRKHKDSLPYYLRES